MEITFLGFTCEIIKPINEGKTHICLYDNTSCTTIANITVNIPEYTPPSNKHVLIHNWYAHNGLIKILEGMGIIKLTGNHVSVGNMETVEAIVI